MPLPDTQNRCRLYLITPSDADADTFSDALSNAISGGDIAAIMVATDDPDERVLQDLAARVVACVRDTDIAVIVRGELRLAARAGADGVHVSGADQVSDARQRGGDDIMIGGAASDSRHEAMEIGESGADYVFFGRIDAKPHETCHPKALENAAWWSNIFQIPGVVLGGTDLSSVRSAVSAGIDFIALREAIWDHPDGPAAAVSAANAMLDECATGMASA